MGAIQRSVKFGVDYSNNSYVAVANGSSSELVPRGDWGSNYYGAKIEGGFLKYYYNSTTDGWEVIAKNGTKYFYGSTLESRQYKTPNLIYKWCLDKVEDRNGNYMSINYAQDQGEIYLDRIDYTGNASLSPSNYVKFYREMRSDAPIMYYGNFSAKMAYRLKTIEIRTIVSSNWVLVRAYKLSYPSYSGSTSRSILSSVQLFGSDAVINGNGDISLNVGTSLPATVLNWQNSGNNFTEAVEWANNNWGSTPKMGIADFNGDGRNDLWFIQPSSPRVVVRLSIGSGFGQATEWSDDNN